MGKAHGATLEISVSDATQQKQANAHVPEDATIGELVSGLVHELNLPKNDSSGRPLTYHARLEREGRHMNATEIVGEALISNDRVMLAPNVDAGHAAALAHLQASRVCSANESEGIEP